jgi:hypothetical protein
MPSFLTVFIFLAAALPVAIFPGPGIFYVAARTLSGGRPEGLASSVGLGIGGLVHVFAGAVGISTLVMASAEAFALLKIAGALYLIWLGLKTWREARVYAPAEVKTTGARQAFREGIVVEAFNPKTAAFFSRLHPAVRRSVRQCRHAVHTPRAHLGRTEYEHRSDRDLLGRQGESKARAASNVDHEGAASVGCTHVRTGCVCALCAPS